MRTSRRTTLQTWFGRTCLIGASLPQAPSGPIAGRLKTFGSRGDHNRQLRAADRQFSERGTPVLMQRMRGRPRSSGRRAKWRSAFPSAVSPGPYAMMTTLRATPEVASSSFRSRLSFNRFINVSPFRKRVEPGAIFRRGAGQLANRYLAEGERRARNHRRQFRRAQPLPWPPVQRPPARAPGTRLRAPERRMEFAPACAILLPFSLLRLRLQPGYPLFEFGCVENPREGIEKAPEFGCFAWGQLAIGHRLHQRRSCKLRIGRGAQLG